MKRKRTQEASENRPAPWGIAIAGPLRVGLLSLTAALIGPRAEGFQAPSPPGTSVPTLGQSLETATPVPFEAIPPAVPAQPEYPIDLSVALRLADVENPEIARARAEILGALALQQAARALLLPTLNAGANYHGHTGNLQRSSGRILSLSEQSLYFGGGSRTLAAESLAFPAVNIVSPITEAWFEPLAARQRVRRTQFDAMATANSTLLEVASLYLELLGAQSRLEALRLAEAQTAEVARITAGFAEAGERREADALRAEVQRQLRRNNVQAAEGEVAAASARLAQRLNLDPSIRLSPRSGPLSPIVLVDPASNPAELTQLALRRRPELVARTAEIAQAQVELREEIFRPLLPTLWLGFSGGAFAGGSNLSQPLFGRTAGRTDFDVRLIWTLMNFGEGNLARQRRRRAEIGRAVAQRSVTINVVRREVASALAISGARLLQIEQARRQLAAADAGFREDLTRSRQNLGKPIEVLDNLELLNEARISLIEAITQYNQAQFRLFVALGSPPPPGPPPTEPIDPPPITTPLHSPFSLCPHVLEPVHPAQPMPPADSHFRLLSHKP